MPLTTIPPFAEPHELEGTMAELINRLGDVPLWRIRLSPPPGTATEDDMLAAECDDHVCELIDGVLVEKAMGLLESQLGFMLGHLLQCYLDQNPIGALFGEKAPFRTIKSRVRLPDLAFLLWTRYATQAKDPPAISKVTPDLAVEVISPSNTKAEMSIKLKEYFDAGVRHVWYIYPKTKTADLYTSPKNPRHIGVDGFLAAEDLLPGFQLRLGELFDRIAPPTK